MEAPFPFLIGVLYSINENVPIFGQKKLLSSLNNTRCIYWALDMNNSSLKSYRTSSLAFRPLSHFVSCHNKVPSNCLNSHTVKRTLPIPSDVIFSTGFLHVFKHISFILQVWLHPKKTGMLLKGTISKVLSTCQRVVPYEPFKLEVVSGCMYQEQDHETTSRNLLGTIDNIISALHPASLGL